MPGGPGGLSTRRIHLSLSDRSAVPIRSLTLRLPGPHLAVVALAIWSTVIQCMDWAIRRVVLPLVRQEQADEASSCPHTTLCAGRHRQAQAALSMVLAAQGACAKLVRFSARHWREEDPAAGEAVATASQAGAWLRVPVQ